MSGGTANVPAQPTQALIKFDLSFLPAGATIVNAGLTLRQTNNGAATTNLHLATGTWDEATVTWNSFGGAFGPTFKTFTNAPATNSINLKAQVQGWVNGPIPNHGVLLEQAGAPKTTFKSSEWGVVAQKPYLSSATRSSAPPASPTATTAPPTAARPTPTRPDNCGGCGNVCAAAGQRRAGLPGRRLRDSAPATSASPTATATRPTAARPTWPPTPTAAPAAWPATSPTPSDSCASGTCTVVSCNAGSFDCNGNNTDGCEPTPCADGSHCGGNADCASNVCVGGFCASPVCNDHTKNGSETDVDCGGGSCPPCADGLECALAGDCQSSVCVGGACAAPTCTDAVKNGNETDVDCGGCLRALRRRRAVQHRGRLPRAACAWAASARRRPAATA